MLRTVKGAREYQRERYAKNAEKVLEQQREYRAKKKAENNMHVIPI